MRRTQWIFFLTAAIGLLGLQVRTASAWCEPQVVECGTVIQTNLHSGDLHDDINTYNCTGGTQYNGNAHVYRLIMPAGGGPLWITLDWTSTGNPLEDIHLFVLDDCNQNHCLAHDPNLIYLPTTSAGNDYWIIVDGRGNAADAQGYVLSIFCGDHPLAAELQSFSGVAGVESINLSWTVASEQDNDHFAIERAFGEADDWSLIGRVEGRGSSTTSATYSFVDHNVVTGNTYRYRLSSVGSDGSSGELSTISVNFGRSEVEVATDMNLLANYPNPFNPATAIRYEALVDADLRLDVYSIDGRLVATPVNGFVEAGYHEVKFDAGNLATGVYLAKLSSANGSSQTIKMMLMK